MKQSKANVSHGKCHNAAREMCTHRPCTNIVPLKAPGLHIRTEAFHFKIHVITLGSHISWKKIQSILVSSVFKPHGDTDLFYRESHSQ